MQKKYLIQIIKRKQLHEESQNFLPEVLYALALSYEVKEGNDWTPFFALFENLSKQERMWDFSTPVQTDVAPRGERIRNYTGDLWKAFTFPIKQAASKRKDSFLNIADCRKAVSLLMLIEPKYNVEFAVLNKGQEYIDAINTLRGSIYDALIEIAVSLAVQTDNKVFDVTISGFLGSRLTSRQVPQELLWVIGASLPKIGYMNIGWIEQNLSSLFEIPEANDLKVLKAYLLYATTVYKDLYSVLQPYYILAVSKFNEQSNYASKLIQHICIARLGKWNGAEAILDKVFNEGNIIHFHEIVKHYGQRTKREKSSTDVDTQAILILWNKMLAYLTENELQENRELAYGLMRWVQNFDWIEDNVLDTVNRTIQLIDYYPFDFIVAKYLRDKVDMQPIQVGQILINGLAKSNGFDFTSYDAIGIITKKLYEKEISEQADEIIHLLVSRNIFFLVDEYARQHVDDLL